MSTDEPAPLESFNTDSLMFNENPDDSPTLSSEPGTYSAIQAIDGDTLEVLIDGKVERIRLIGIDTPETLDQRKPVQCFGLQASTRMHQLADGQQVRLESDPIVGDKDKYSRLLRYAFVGDTLLNEQMILEGFAHEYTYQTSYKYQTIFKNAELSAQAGQIGFWSLSTCGGNTEKPATS